MNGSTRLHVNDAYCVQKLGPASHGEVIPRKLDRYIKN